MKKIGLYGGTFDPIHFGHLNLAFELMEKQGLDEVWFIPARVSPHKQQTCPFCSIDHRLEMIKLALEGIHPFKLKDFEKHLPEPSYTFSTIQSIFLAQEKASSQSNQFYLLLGEDSIPGFFRWHQPEELIKLVPLLIGSRSCDYHLDQIEGSLSIKKAIQKGLVSTRVMDISSTEVRNRLSKGLCCKHLVPSTVLDYIHNRDLYSYSND